MSDWLALSALLLLWAPPVCPQTLSAHPGTVPIADMERGVDVVYAPPGCMAWGWMSMTSVQTIFTAAEEISATYYLASSGMSGLFDGARLLVPEVDTHDASLSSELLADPSKATRLVLEPNFPVLLTPYDMVFQYPFDGQVDWLEHLSRPRSSGVDVSSAGATRVAATLVRYTLPSGAQVLSIELPGSSPVLGEVTTMTRTFAGRGEMLTEDAAVDLYVVPTPLYSAGRARSVLSTMLSERPPADRPGASVEEGPAPFFLHPGGVVPEHVTADERALCAKGVAGLSPTALVPRSGELSLGPEALLALAGRHQLNYLAANLHAVEEASSSRPLKRFFVEDRGGLKIAVIGLVGADMLADLPVDMRARWRVDDPLVSFRQARDALDRQEGRRPDLTVVLLASDDGETLNRIEQAWGADVVIGDFSGRISQMGKREHHEVVSDGRGREGVRFAPPLVRVAGSSFSVGRISARFASTQVAGRARLSAIVHDNRVVRFEGPVHETFAQERRRLEERLIPQWNEVLLPDVAPMVRRHRELEELVYGDAVLSHGRVTSYPRSIPASFTDPLWMRLITNVLKEELGADVALSRNLPRAVSIIGPLQRFFVESWLRHPDVVRVVEVSGQQLSALSARLAMRSKESLDPRQIFSAGIDPATARVGGRPIDPRHTYRVVVTDHVLSTVDLGPLLATGETESLFRADATGAWHADEGGAPLTIKDVVEALFKTWLDEDTDAFDARHAPALEALLLDQSDRLMPRWHLQVDELSVRGSSLSNTSNVATFAPSKETRVNTPEHFSIGFKSDFGVQYDGPEVTWDNTVHAQLQRQEFSAVDQPTTVQEAADDLVLSTELRFNSVKMDIGEHGVPLVPYIQTSYDTEFTAIESPTEEDPSATLPHQHVLRAAVGQVMTSGTWLKEVRLGALFQEDFSERPLRYDAGLVTGAKLEFTLYGPVVFKSQLDVRYLFPDGNDTVSDLGFVLTNLSQIVIPVTSGMNLLVFADSYLVAGKLEETSALGGSQVYGLGLDFARYFRL